MIQIIQQHFKDKKTYLLWTVRAKLVNANRLKQNLPKPLKAKME